MSGAFKIVDRSGKRPFPRKEIVRHRGFFSSKVEKGIRFCIADSWFNGVHTQNLANSLDKGDQSLDMQSCEE